MSERDIDIADMQCWVFRMAQSKWNMSSSDCAELFKKYDILGFISECYDILHLNSYSCVLHDVETLLKNRGVIIYQNYNFTDSQKENCAVNLMCDTVEALSLRDNLSYEDALLHFASSKVYDALFDYDTGIWKEGTDYLLNLYDYCNSLKSA